MTDREFGPELFSFLRDLKDHNDRDWFQANKDRYENDLLEPALAFIEDFGLRLPEISPHLVADARRQGGSLFRIHRDTRFSNNKLPYKGWQGSRLFHERRHQIPAPSFYVHIQPGESFAGGLRTWSKIEEDVSCMARRRPLASRMEWWSSRHGEIAACFCLLRVWGR